MYEVDKLLVDLLKDNGGMSERRTGVKIQEFKMSRKDFENLICLVNPAFNNKNTN
jgi:hypothetical protein